MELGIGLAKAGKKVLLVDADPQASLTIGLGNPQPDKLPVTFVEKIVVHEADKSTGDRIQKADIYFNFIGKLPEPEESMTEEQKEKEKKALVARNREREWNRLRMRRVRANQKAERALEE